MENSIVNRSFATYQLASAKIEEAKNDNKTKYVVAEFVKAGLDDLMSEQENAIRLQILPRFGVTAEQAEAYLQKWVDKAKQAEPYKCNIGTYEVGGFEPFLRKDTQGNWLTTNKDGKKVKTMFNSVFIFWFCDEDGNPIKGDNYIVRRGVNLFNNSSRITTVAAYKAAKEKAKAAAEAARAVKDDLVADADGLDDEI